MRLVPIVAVPLLVALVVSLAAAAAPEQPEARATAVVSRVVQPGLPDQYSLALTAPPPSEQVLPGYAYPADGSVITIRAANARVLAQPGVSSSAQADVGVSQVVLFGGEIVIDAVDIRASAAAGAANAFGNVSTASVTGLTVLGQLVNASTSRTVQLADWGKLELLTSSADAVQEPPRSAQASVTAARVTILADHGGLAAGSAIEIGSASVFTSVAPTASPPKTTAPPSKPQQLRPVIPADAPREPGQTIPGAPPELVRPAPEVTAQLSSGGYVFPVYGPASFSDTFGAPRPDVSGGWHHGEDIFAPLGTPLLAVTDGTVFSVGWNDIGGWRIWLRDATGNEFYYAHLSAYSPLAVNGTQVRAGDVLGFMGRTGDAEHSPVHLHFEIHPASLLDRGYDGAVAPYPFLNAWRRAQDVSFDAGRAYLPLDGAGGQRGFAPPAGAVLLEAEDISSTSGLVPGALETTLAGRAPKSPTGGQDR